MNNHDKNQLIKAQSKSAHKSRVWLGITSVIFIILLIFILLNRVAVIDTFKGIGYNPTPDMLEIKTSLSLTGDGERIWNATHPILASRDDFNNSCESHDEAVSVLGCYTGSDRMFIYNVDEPTLTGIRESTSAHEFLHAVWSRLSGYEKTNIIPILELVYSEHSADLKETIEAYEKDEQLSELYVRIGTQIADLPDSLETHYAKFFSDQDKIVNFYKSYITPFTELKEKIENLKEELETLEKEIKTKSESLDARLETLEDQIDEFNDCANTAGCFNNWTFATRRAELVAEQQSINAENSVINSLIDNYNQKVDTYNNSILRSTKLQNLINSNSSETKIEE